TGALGQEPKPPKEEFHGPTAPLGVENPNPPSATCASPPKPEPIKLEELEGLWVDDATGEQIELRREGYSSSAKFVGRHTWYGDYSSDGTLKLHRYPEPTEMGAGPDWAKKNERGQVKWELE